MYYDRKFKKRDETENFDSFLEECYSQIEKTDKRKIIIVDKGVYRSFLTADLSFSILLTASLHAICPNLSHFWNLDFPVQPEISSIHKILRSLIIGLPYLSLLSTSINSSKLKLFVFVPL